MPIPFTPTSGPPRRRPPHSFKRIFRSRGKYSDFESGAEGGAGRLTPSPSLGDVKQEAAPAAEVQKKPAKIACAKGEDPKVSVLRPDGTVSGVTRVVLPDAQEELRINGGRHAFRSTPEVTGVQQGDEVCSAAAGCLPLSGFGSVPFAFLLARFQLSSVDI